MMLKIGVVGAGHLGKIHLKILKESSFVDLMGFYDINDDVRKQVTTSLEVKSFESLDELIQICDIVDIVTPTLSHYYCAQKAMVNGKHVFIEKPVTQTISEVKNLIKLANKHHVKAQVGHVERFNPAFKIASKEISKPKFIETHRLAQFNPRGTDVSVVLDLMIHDLDILLHVVNSPIKNIHANGVAVLSDTSDIANARIEFLNGCVANLTASRMSLKNMRKSRFFQKDSYISVDFLNKKFEFICLEEIKEPEPFVPVIDLGPKGKKKVVMQTEKSSATNPIEEELKSFVNSIHQDKSPEVDLISAQKVLQLAIEISEQITVGQN